MMQEVTNTLPILWQWVLSVCGMIVAIGGAAAILSKLKKPMRDMRAQIKAIEKAQEGIKRSVNEIREESQIKIDNDRDAINAIRKGQEQMCSCMLALIDHAITGNSVERLKQERGELFDYLIQK